MPRGGRALNAFAIISMMLLLSGGFLLYAAPAAAQSGGGPPGGNSGEPSRLIYFHLVPVSAEAKSANASGYAGISVGSGSLALEWSISGGSSGQALTMVMDALNETGTSQTFSFPPVQVSPQGAASGSGSAALAPGNYTVGLSLVSPSAGSSVVVFASDPATAQVTVGAPQPPPPTAAGGALSYALLPLPAYLHEQPPAGFPFRQGGALIVVSGGTLQVTTSFQGAPGVSFEAFVQTAQDNITVGTVTTTTDGAGEIRGNVTLAPGSYGVGILVFESGNTGPPVAVSVPRAIEVTIGTPAQTSSGTSSSSETSPPSSTQASGPGVRVTRSLGFAPITVANAKAYAYGKGSGGYAVLGGKVYFSLSFTGQTPNAPFSLDLTVDGSERILGSYVTDSSGSGRFTANATLGNGTFVLGLTVLDVSSFSSPTPVLASVPATFTVLVFQRTTSTSSQTSSSSSSTSQGRPAETWAFQLVPSGVQDVPQGYRFASSGTAVVSFAPQDSVLNVELGFQGGNPSTTYTAALVLNGTTESLGTMTTNRDGGTLLRSSVQVSAGTYLLGVVVFDVSDLAAFNASAPVPVLVSSPATVLAVIGAAVSYTTSSTSSSAASPSPPALITSTKTATTLSEGTKVQAQIQSAVDNLTIPATVQVTPLESTTNVLDPRFSVSVGQQVGNGLVIAISGENVTGPRVLLINMSKTAPLALYPALNVTLDGAPVAEASSALQVLNPLSTNPPLYVLVSTSTSIQLLVSIPHFSLHLIQVTGVVIRSVVTSLELDTPLLIGSILVISLAFAGAYAARKRYFLLI